MGGTSEEFKAYLESVVRAVHNNGAPSIEGIVGDLKYALDWELHDLQEVTTVTVRLNEYLQSGGLFGHDRSEALLDVAKETSAVLRKRLVEHRNAYVAKLKEQLELLVQMRAIMLKTPVSVTDLSKLLELEERTNRVKEECDKFKDLTGPSALCRKSDLVRLEENNQFMRKIVNLHVNSNPSTVTTIKHRRNVIVADFSGVVFYIDIGGSKIYDSEVAIIAGNCYQAMMSHYGEGVDNKITTGEIRELSVCFKHEGRGQGSIVFQEVADAKTIKSFEDTLYNRKGE